MLKKFGVELTDLEGKFVGPYEAVNRLSAALNRIDPRDTQFSQIVEELGGFRQISKVIPLIQQVEARTQALGVAQKGSTSLTEAAATAQESLANQFAKVREQFLAFVRSVSETSSFKAIIGLTLKLASGLISVADAAKPLIPLLAVVGAVKGFSAFRQVTSGFFGGIRGGTVGAAAAANGGPGGGGGSGGAGGATAANTVSVNQNTYAIQHLTASINDFSHHGFGTPYPVGASSPVPGRRFARGGLVPGSGSGDTVPAMLAPGEFVLRKSAVNSIGAGHLSKVNLANGPGSSGQGVSKTLSGLTPEQQLIAKQAEFAAQNGQPATREGFFALPNKLRNQFKNSNKAQAADDRQAARDFYIDGSQFAGIFLNGGPSVINSVSASSIKKSGSSQLNQQLIKFGVPKDKNGKAIKSGINIVGHAKGYNVKPGSFNDNIGKVYDNIEKDIAHIVSDELGSSLSSPSIITASLKSQKASISGSIFEAAFKAVTGNNSKLFLNEDHPVFDFQPAGRDNAAKFEALLGKTDIKSHKYADAKINGSSDNLSSLYGKALASNIPITKKAGGGHIGGSGTGDSVPALLTPGEFVINKRAADHIGRDVLHGMNSGKVGRFSGGTPFPSRNPNSRNNRSLFNRLGLRLQDQVNNGSATANLTTLAGGAFLAQQGVESAFGAESPASQGFSAAIGGAASGAYLGGKVGGAPGAAIGAIIGGLSSGVDTFVKAVKSAQLKDAFDKLSKATDGVEKAFDRFTSGLDKNPDKVNAALGGFTQGIGSTVDLSRLSDRDALSEARGQGTISTLLGQAYGGAKNFIGLDTSEDFKKDSADIGKVRSSRRNKVLQESQGGANVALQLIEQQLHQGANLLSKDSRGHDILSASGLTNRNAVDALAFKGAQGEKTISQLEGAAIRKDEKSDANRGDSKKLAEIQADYEKEARDILTKNGIEVLKITSDRVAKENALLEAYRNSGKTLIAFSKIFAQIGAIADVNSAKLEASNALLDARVSSLTGQAQIGPADNSLSTILNNKDAFSKDEYGAGVDRLTGAFGNSPALAQTAAFAKGGKTLDDDLTKIISDSLIKAKKGAGKKSFEAPDEEGDSTVANSVKAGVAELGLPKALADSVSAVLAKELASRQGKTFEDIVESFKNGDKFAPAAQVAQESQAKLATAFDKAVGLFNQNLNKLVGLRGGTLAAGDKAAGIRANSTIELAEAFGKELTAQQLNAPIQGQISRLGGGVTDPGQLGVKFQTLNDVLEKTIQDQALAQKNNDGNELVRLGKVAAETAAEIDRTKKALELLADGTKKAAIQTKLGEIQQRREAGRNFLTTIGTAGPQQQFQFFKQAASFLQFRQQGNKLSGNPFQAEGVQGFIQLIGPLLGKEKNADLNKQFTDALFNSSPFAAAIKSLPQEIQDSLRAAITKQGEAPQEEQLIIELKAVQTAQERAADALTTIADKAENVYGKQIVEQLQAFVTAISANLNGIHVAAPVGKARGGWIHGYASGGSVDPRDTVHAMLQPGEFVVRKDAAQAHMGLLEEINGYANGGSVFKKNTAYDIALSKSQSSLEAEAKSNALHNYRVHQAQKAYDTPLGVAPKGFGLEKWIYDQTMAGDHRVSGDNPASSRYPGLNNARGAGNTPSFNERFAKGQGELEAGRISNYGVNTPAAIPRVKESRTPVWNPKTRRYEFVHSSNEPTKSDAEARARIAYNDERKLGPANAGAFGAFAGGAADEGGAIAGFGIQVAPAAKDVALRNFQRDIQKIRNKDALQERQMRVVERAKQRASLRHGGDGFNPVQGPQDSPENRVYARAASRASARRGRLGYATGGEVGGAAGGQSNDNFVKAVQNLGTYIDKFANIKIPESITLTATIKPVQVVFSGENALASAVVEQMTAQITSMVQSAMRAHINPLTGETNEGTINPSSISNRIA